jgi:transcription elongation factor GreA
MSNKILISEEKLNELKTELDFLVNTKRPEVINLIQEARSQGDLSENADYDAAKDQQAEIENKITQIKYTLENYEIIHETSGSIVSIGSTVEIEDLSNKEKSEYTIVGHIEADITNNKISNHSPLAISLLGNKKGDIVLIAGVKTPYKIKIISVKN